MALFYKYAFDFGGLVKWFYAADEDEARLKFKEAYGVKPGKLIKRERW